jgi:threonine dehydratase
MVELQHIRDARDRIAGQIRRTPLLRSSALGRMAGVRLFLKAEPFQKTGSFKVRGVFNRIALMPEAERSRGLIAISAGNHAQAVAYAASATGLRSIVVMPESAATTKVEASREYGAEIVLHGDVFAAFARMEELRARHGYTLVHPFDDEDMIAGHGTLGLELLEDLPDPDIVLVPVGGGGLLAGIATAIKAVRPGTRVVGVEPEGAAGLRAAIDAGHVVRLERILTVADGLAPPSTGEIVLRQIRDVVDDVVTVSDAAIVRAVGLLMTRAKLVAEPSGAAGLAALMEGACGARPGDRVIVVVSGGNIDVHRLKEIFGGGPAPGAAGRMGGNA